MAFALPADGKAATHAGRWHTQQWTTEHGLPQNSVKAIAQTPDGYLWIGTLNGLARFDGISFTTYTRGNTPDLVSDAINALTVDPRGTLWVATADGLIAWRQGVTGRWGKSEGMPGSAVFGVVASPGGKTWWREDYSCGQLKDGRVTHFGAEHGLATNRVWSIIPARNGGLIALTQPGVQRMEAGGERFGELLPWPASGSDWRGMEDSAGRLWASGNSGTFRCESNRWAALSADAGFGAGTRFFEDASGQVWIVSREKGLCRLRPDDTLSTPVFKPENSLSAWLEDREGNLWLGAAGEGLYRLRPQRIRTWTTSDGLPDNRVRSLCVGPDGSVWAGTERGLARIHSGQVESFSDLEPQPRYGAFPILVDRAGAVWCPKYGHGLLRFDGREFKRFPVMPEAPGFHVSSLHEDRAGQLCVGINNGVSIWRDGRFEWLFESNRVGGQVGAMFEDRAGRWWIGSKNGGVKCFDGERSATLTTTDGLSDNKALCFHEDADDTLWIGTENGLNRIKNGRITALRTGQGLPENVVNHILEDDAGNLWWSGLKGIHRASRAHLNAVAEGRTNRVPCLTYGETDGMASGETNGELQPAGGRTADGHLWFPTIKGVVEIDPRLLVGQEMAPPVIIEQIKADEVEVTRPKSGRESLSLAAGEAHVLEFHFTANSLSAPEKVRFKYRLEPRDREWREIGSQRFAFFQNLRPGNYTFRVSAANHHGLWNEAGANATFSVAPYFHETWWFYALCGLAIVGAAGVVQACRLRVQRRIAKLEQARVLQEERTRIARDLHDELGSRLTALAVRADLAGAAAPGDGARLRALAGESRALAERMRDVIWAVDPKCDSLEALVSRLTGHAEDFLGATGIGLRLELPETLPALPLSAEARHQLTMVAKEALNNALKHSRATEVRLGVELDDHALHLRIGDNGSGLEPARPGGRGMSNMRERLHALGGTLDILAAPGGGTLVHATVPRAKLNPPAPRP